MKRENLVISAVGDESVHGAWLSGGVQRQFDLCLIYFGSQQGKYQRDADHYVEQQGIKFSMIHSLSQTVFKDILPRYDMVWLPDDDIAADTDQINELFQLAAEYQLQIAQPAIAKGPVSYRALRRHPEYILRYTGFVEMMCPLFSAAALKQVLPLFGENVSGWGLDWAWSNMFASREVAVIDAVGVHHTREIQAGGVHARFAKLGIDPCEESDLLGRKYSMSSPRWRRRMARNEIRVQAVSASGFVWTKPLWKSVWPMRKLLKAA